MNTKKRGLGRGLDALLSTVKTDVVAERDQVQSLPVEFIQSGRFQPRKDFDEEKLRELADSISAQGVVQPIVVREMEANRYEIIAGERRWRATQMAGLHDIPVVIRKVTDQAALAIALIENIQREDLSPLEEAEALRRLQEEFTMTHQQIADAVGKSRVTVTNLLRLNELNPVVKEHLQNRQLEMGHARAILGIEFGQQIDVARKVVQAALTVRETERLIRRLQEESKNPPATPVRKDPDISRLEEKVTQTLGAKVSIQHQSSGQGKMVIQYENLDQLEGVLARLGQTEIS
jgi:ParB family chromosome partitioning protein